MLILVISFTINQIYGLPKVSLTDNADWPITGAQPDCSINTPLNPILIALASGCRFVARGFAGEQEQLTELMQQAIRFKGYALLDILQPCVSFKKINTYEWYKQRVKPIGDHA
jgi:2-oxoglutarate ferredoxin oxidoreductase subunit beta